MSSVYLSIYMHVYIMEIPLGSPMPPASRKIGLHAFHEFLLGIFSGPVCGGNMGMPDALGNIFTMVQYQNWKKKKTSPQKNTASRNVDKILRNILSGSFFFKEKRPGQLVIVSIMGISPSKRFEKSDNNRNPLPWLQVDNKCHSQS